MFRYENPQKGRYRQFHQIGVETYGIETPDADLEMFLLLQHYFESIALSEVSFQLNSIGCNKEECRPTYKKLLLHYLQDISASLCSECLRRKDVNPLRVLDCKTCHSLTQEIPIIYKHLCNNCETHFSELQEMLQFHKIPYQLNPRLVRGLDYYSKTVFEVYSGNLGSQSAAGGGGRYDDLFQIYGAKKTPAIGFALGMDRLAMLIETPSKSPIDIFVIGDQRKEILKMVSLCRKSGYSTLYDPFQSSMKSQFRQANRVNAKKVIILGEEEIKHHQITLKDMENGTQIKLDEHKLSKHLSSFI